MVSLAQAIPLIEKMNKEMKWGQSSEPTLCRFCGGSIPHGNHSSECLKGKVDAFLQEEYQYREDFGPNGDATTPGFFNRD